MDEGCEDPGRGSQPPSKKKHKPRAPACDNNSIDSLYLQANYAAATSLSTLTGVPVDWILAWSAAEGGSATGAGYGQSTAALINQNYFGQTSTDWTGAIACPPNAVAGYACFANFAASASAELTTSHMNWTWVTPSGVPGVGSITVNPVSAATILDSYGGQNVTAAFQAVADAGQARGNTRYGAGVAQALIGVDFRLTCLGLGR